MCIADFLSKGYIVREYVICYTENVNILFKRGAFGIRRRLVWQKSEHIA